MKRLTPRTISRIVKISHDNYEVHNTETGEVHYAASNKLAVSIAWLLNNDMAITASNLAWIMPQLTETKKQ